MNPRPCPSDLEAFRRLLARRLGLLFDDTKLTFLAQVAWKRAEALGQPCETYLPSLSEPAVFQAELPALAGELTVPETYFFRHSEQLSAFSDAVLRPFATHPHGSLQVLCAGCATGEEPYSLAMLARDVLGDRARAVRIRAVDLSPAALEKARRGRYTAWSMRETPQELQERWFTRKGHEFILDPAIRHAVAFEQANLAQDDPGLWPPEHYDVVFCRNVLIYFSPDQAQALVGRAAGALKPGGHLFLGSAENLRGLSQDFDLVHTHGTFFYRRKGVPGPTALPLAPVHLSPPGPNVPPGAWIGSIQQAADRIQGLTEAPAGGPACQPWDRTSTLDLLRAERYAQALEGMKDLPSGSERDPDVLLLRAVLLTHCGQREPAAGVCEALLALDGMNAGAHYVLALGLEAAGDVAGAMEQDRISAYLDPGFAMPRLHLGLLARRSGDRAAALRELGRASELLQREDSSRLLLFGGGFSRSALTALCRAELAAVGGAP